MEEQLLYKNLACYYDKLYQGKDYEKEVLALKKVIQEFKLSPGKNLLDVACGTGKHIEYFSDEFICTGIDINAEILNFAQKKISKQPLSNLIWQSSY